MLIILPLAVLGGGLPVGCAAETPGAPRSQPSIGGSTTNPASPPAFVVGTNTTTAAFSNWLAGLPPGPRIVSTASAAERLVEIPFELANNRPFVSVRVNGSKPRRFLFDTGASGSLIGRKTVAKLGLRPTTNVTIGPMKFAGIHGVRFALGAASYAPKMVYVDPIESERRMTDVFFDGVIGCDLLEEFVVEIDYRAEKLRLRNPASYKHGGNNLLILFDLGRPYIDATMVVGDGRQRAHLSF